MKKKQRKKKKRFGYYLYAFVLLLLSITNVLIAVFLLTYVQKINVTGTCFCTENQIADLIREDPLTANSVYAVVKYKLAGQKLPPYLEDLAVTWDRPWQLHVRVKEKPVIGGLLIKDGCVYFSEDGTILVKGVKTLDNVAVVEGVQVVKSGLYETLETEDKREFSYVCGIVKALKETDLAPDRVVWEEDSMNLYCGGVCVKLGKLNFDEKLLQAGAILPKLEGKTGVLHLEHYNEMSTSISFEESEKNY